MHMKLTIVVGVLGGALAFGACQRDAYDNERTRTEERARAAETTTPPYGSSVDEAASPSRDTRSGTAGTAPESTAGQGAALPSDTSDTSGARAPVTGTGSTGSTGSTTGTREGMSPPNDDDDTGSVTGSGSTGTGSTGSGSTGTGSTGSGSTGTGGVTGSAGTATTNGREVLIDDIYRQYTQMGQGSLDRDTFVLRCTESARGVNTGTLAASDRNFFARTEIRSRCRDLQQMPIPNDATSNPSTDDNRGNTGTGTDSRGNVPGSDGSNRGNTGTGTDSRGNPTDSSGAGDLPR
jgi:hypothetical protein